MHQIHTWLPNLIKRKRNHLTRQQSWEISNSRGWPPMLKEEVQWLRKSHIQEKMYPVRKTWAGIAVTEPNSTFSCFSKSTVLSNTKPIVSGIEGHSKHFSYETKQQDYHIEKQLKMWKQFMSLTDNIRYFGLSKVYRH